MTREQAHKIEAAAEKIDLGVEVSPSYSGRYMFGATTWAVSGDRSDVLDACFEAGVNPGKLRQDQMGLGIVLY